MTQRDSPVNPFDGLLEQAMVAYLMVRGMACSHCATYVRNSLLALRHVVLADVFLDKGMAAVAYNPAHLLPETLLRAVQRAGRDIQHSFVADILMISNAAATLTQVPEGRSWTLPDGTQKPVVYFKKGWARS